MSSGIFKSIESLRRIHAVAAFFIIAVLLLLLVRQTAHILFVIFTGILLGIFLDSMAEYLGRWLRLGRGWALSLVLLVLLGSAVLIGWLAGPAIVFHAARLQVQLPEIVARSRATISQGSLGQLLLPSSTSLLSQLLSGLLGKLPSLTTAVLVAVSDTALVLLTGVFFAFDTAVYREGALLLFAAPVRPRVRRALTGCGHALRRFLWGRVLVMLLLGVMTWLGLLSIGVPLASLLGLITAICSFVPFIGPLVAAVPAVLVSLSVGPQTALYALLIYTVVQTIENNIINPLAQQYIVQLPPVMLIAAETVFGILTGVLGLIFAAPVTVVIVVLIQSLYVRDMLGERIRLLGE
jgi:predicted PurR-regulated permease PerM